MSMPGKPERDFLVNELLPAAFLADIFDVLLESNIPAAWSKTANLIFFLDGFEALQSASSETATRLLELLTVRQRRGEKTDPILLVVGGRDYLPGSERKDDRHVLTQRLATQSEQELQGVVKTWYAQWQQSFPADKHYLQIEDLYLTFELQDFEPEDTRSYLLKFGEQRQTRLFADNEALVQTIGQLTQGHPLFLALASAAALEANARGRPLTRDDFELAKVSPDIVERHSRERIRDYLLELFLRQLSEAERKELIFCAVPRYLDFALLRVLLPTLDDIDRQKRRDSYQRLTFMRPLGNDRLAFHPIVRMLLLRQLPADQAPESDYYRLHASLRDYFHKLAQKATPFQEAATGQAQIEEAYHVLALGDPNPAIAFGVFAQQRNLTLWEPLLEAVAQAPTELMPGDVGQQASNARGLATRHRNVEDAVKAVILYIWLLTASMSIPVESACLENSLGIAYCQLHGVNREANLRRAIESYKAALQVYTREAFPIEWAMTQNNLGLAYRNLTSGDREVNVSRAIECFELALQVRTREAFPIEWAMTQNNLGMAFLNLTRGDREENVRRAIECFKLALQVRTREAFPVEWARTQDNLGLAYSSLSQGDVEVNIRQALTYHEAALQVRTREMFPGDWATTQNNLGLAYSRLLGGDRQKNLKQAIKYFKAALQVYTQEDFPVEWAKIQNNLGEVHRLLPTGDREANLRQAIAYYEAALQVYTQEAFPIDWAITQNHLELAYSELTWEIGKQT
jgi:tetratricopeptide (TPR) repeat protein